MTTEEIYQKYATAIANVTGDGSWIDWGVMRLALRLAVQDAHAAGLETCSDLADDLAAIVANQAQAPDPDQRVHEHLQSQISRLNEWLAAHKLRILEHFANRKGATGVVIGR